LPIDYVRFVFAYSLFSIMRFWVLGILVMAVFSVSSQQLFPSKFLIVDRLHGKKRYRFVPKQGIRLKTKDKEQYFGEIQELFDEALSISGDTIPLKEIKLIYLDEQKAGARIISALLIRAGIGYMAISTFNRTINDDSPQIHSSVYSFGIPALGIGFLIKYLIKPKVRIKHPEQLKVIDFN